jgi:hypothetical protein
VWAGAQTKDGDTLDPDFVERLHAVLNLTDKNGLHVMLDNHGDMTGTLGCGNGVPAWFQMKAPGMSKLLGKPLETDLPYSLVSSLEIKKVGGYEHCGSNATMWSKYAGDPNYNIKLGTYYFNSLLEDYDGVFPFAIGAYNAGPNRIKSWVKRYGDPNKGEINFIDWIELIRFKETRNYVQRVIENIHVYKFILENKPTNNQIQILLYN